MRLVSINEAAQILSVHRETIIRGIRSGKFKTINVSAGEERETIRIDIADFLISNGIDPKPYFASQDEVVVDA